MDAVTDFEQILAHAGITPDKPLYATLIMVHNATLELDAKIETLQMQTAPDIERAVRMSLTGLRPVFEQRWRWQRWIGVGVALVVGMTTLGIVCAADWGLSASVARRDASIDIMQWQTWWRDTCGERSPNHIVLNGKPVCQVPMEQAGKSAAEK